MPLISIVVPIFNMEKYLSRCCKTLSDQTFTDFEVLLIDDGSTDTSANICVEWCVKDERFKYFYKKNGGLGDTRNYGIFKAFGEYITFCDPDDWLDVKCYEEISEIILKYHPDMIGFGYFNCFDGKPKDEVISYIPEGLFSDLNNTILPDMIAKKYLFSADNRPVIKSACMHLYRKILLMEKNIKFTSEHVVLNEDFLFNIEVITKAESYYCLHKAYYYYDTVSGSLTQRHIKDMYSRKRSTSYSLSFYGHVVEELSEDFEMFISKNANTCYNGVFDATQNEIYKKLNEYDVLLFPTVHAGEGVPGILVEAKMSGVCPIVSDRFYNNEIVLDEIEGIVIEEDYSKSLAREVKRLLNDQDTLQRLKEGSYQSRKRYTMETYVEELWLAVQ